MSEFFKMKNIWLFSAYQENLVFQWLFKISTKTEIPVKPLLCEYHPLPLGLGHFICSERPGPSSVSSA